MVPEVYMQWMKVIYHGATSHVKTVAGQSKPFRTKNGVHQESVLSLLFITVMDAVTEAFERQPPWTLLYAGDMAENKKE
ncbi:unnamed protein product [Strongylus vulgaris]|uniref:Reverse transcriptase domain-containing protein n=1 Tax=Strongylus vulgaris TaxID=40348 RepID=A0A3P7IQS1_STRVU|nr:unnamed protein product [Strongylus vulgaris]